MCDVGCRHRFFLGIGTKTVNLAAHVNCGFVERVTEVRTRIAADDQGSSLSHESGHVSHAAADNDLAAFQRETTAGGGIVFDEQQSAVTGRSGALGGAAFDTNRARHDVFGDAPADVAVDGDVGFLVHPRDEVTGVPTDVDFRWRIQSDSETMHSVGIQNFDVDRQVSGQFVVQIIVELTDRDAAQIELD